MRERIEQILELWGSSFAIVPNQEMIDRAEAVSIHAIRAIGNFEDMRGENICIAWIAMTLNKDFIMAGAGYHPPVEDQKD